MPGADGGPLTQGGRRDFRAISPITQPPDSPGRGCSAHPWARGASDAATWPLSAPHPGWALAGPHQGTKRNGHPPPAPRWPGPHAPVSFCARVLARRPVPPGSTSVSSHPQSAKPAGARDPSAIGSRHLTRLRDLSLGHLGSQLWVAGRRKETQTRVRSAGRALLAVAQHQPTPPHRSQNEPGLPAATRLLPGHSLGHRPAPVRLRLWRSPELN